MRYYQHRISYLWDVSKPLFDKGILTIGWEKYQYSDIINESRNNGRKGFDTVYEEKTKSKVSLYRFLTIKEGDIIIVPLYEKTFAIVKAKTRAKPIKELPLESMTSISQRKVITDGTLKYEGEETGLDLGFYIEIELQTEKPIPRAYALPTLQSRMKTQWTTVEIKEPELKDAIEQAKTATGPVNIHDIIVQDTIEAVHHSFEKLNPDEFERLIVWYMEQCGASKVYIPPKNEKGKSNGADADIIAEFDHLGIVIMIQAKRHDIKSKTNDWPVEQIAEYKSQKENNSNESTYITWVITSAETFTDSAYPNAQEAGVRLIDGKTFAKMILDTGIKSINEVKKG